MPIHSGSTLELSVSPLADIAKILGENIVTIIAMVGVVIAALAAYRVYRPKRRKTIQREFILTINGPSYQSLLHELITVKGYGHMVDFHVHIMSDHNVTDSKVAFYSDKAFIDRISLNTKTDTELLKVEHLYGGIQATANLRDQKKFNKNLQIKLMLIYSNKERIDVIGTITCELE